MMRRKDREITDIAEIKAILDGGEYCNIAVNSDDGYPYVFPLSYGYTLEDGFLTLYFHSAKVGRKIDLIKANPKCSFSIAVQGDLIASDVACKYSTYYSSILGTGEICEATDNKVEALTHIMKQYDKNAPLKFDEASLNAVSILTIKTNAFVAKGKLNK